jgi:S1-C subfamily serine protease
MGSNLRIGILTSIITAALVYVVLEWRSPPLVPETVSSETRDPDRSPSPPVQATPASVGPVTPLLTPSDLISAQSADEQNNIDIYRKYSQSVVNVASRTYSYNFFLQAVPAEGIGSGFVIDDGLIVTNYHVIQSPDAELEVTLWDQSRHPATVVGVDPNNDVALLRVDSPDTRWVPLPMGTTQGLQVGQKVLAIGNPFGLGHSLTTGIISSLGRAIQAPVESRQVIIEGIIQTDAAINQGNSGGPLLNTDGELIGINTAMMSDATGIGFAVPVDTVRRVTGDLLTYGRVRRAYLGLDGAGLSQFPGLAEALQLGTETGVMTFATSPGGPAAEAGVRGPDRQVRYSNFIVPVGGDIIVSLDGRTIRSSTDIGSALEAHRPGDRVPMRVVRDGQELELEITLQEEPVLR